MCNKKYWEKVYKTYSYSYNTTVSRFSFHRKNKLQMKTIVRNDNAVYTFSYNYVSYEKFIEKTFAYMREKKSFLS